MAHAFLYSYVRTPFGRIGGALAGVRPDDLAAHVLRHLVSRNPGLDVDRIDEIVWGCANQAGEDNRNVARMAGLLAELPVHIPATTVNRLCGSSLDAVIGAARAIECGDSDLLLVGGVESMTRAPWVMPKPSRAFPVGDVTAVSTTLGWRLVNPAMPEEWTISLGLANERLGQRLEVSRERQDDFALRSHQLAHQAWENGFYDDWVSGPPGSTLTRDEGIRADASLESLRSLRPAFSNEGTITAGNSSPLSDGASAVILGSERANVGSDPVARIAGKAAFANDPRDFGIAPVQAAERALARANITWKDVGAVELNEAFAVQSLACTDAWLVSGLSDPSLVNDRGGAIALGHPLGASGGRILATLAHRLLLDNQRWGVAAICIGVGQGLAVVLENTAGSRA